MRDVAEHPTAVIHQLIQMGSPWQNPVPYLAPGFRLTRTWQPHHGQARLTLYQRGLDAARVPARCE